MVHSLTKVLFLKALLFFFLTNTLIAQEDLSNTFKKNKISHASTHKILTPYYKHPSKNRMYSNDCVHDYTSTMGFEYVILTGDCEKALGHLSGGEVRLHNFTVAVGLVFKRGPFWKNKVKKRYRFCLERMGDTVD
ncbi:MAG: hypothetical protein H7329_06275 [Opitutaceae bacterium]|nr:hypothetical protein [Cytophagales bacterium]